MNISSNFLTPGPGSYTYYDKISGGVRFARSQRRGFADVSSQLGPGAYNVQDVDRKKFPSYVIKPDNTNSKTNLKQHSDGVPGPGNYNPKFHRKGYSFGFGTSSKELISIF